MSRFDRSRPNDLLVAVTEKRTKDDLDRYVDALREWTRSRVAKPTEEPACKS